MKITEETLREFISHYLKEAESKRKDLLLEQGLSIWRRIRVGGGTYYGRGVVKNGWLGNAIRTANPAISELMRRAGRFPGLSKTRTLPATYFQNAQRAIARQNTYQIDLNDVVIARIRRDWLDYQTTRHANLNDYDIRLAAHRAAKEYEEANILQSEWTDAQNDFLSKWFDDAMRSNPLSGNRSDTPGSMFVRQLPPPDAARAGRDAYTRTVVKIPGTASGQDAFLYRNRPVQREVPPGAAPGAREVDVELPRGLESGVTGILGRAYVANEIIRWASGLSLGERAADLVYLFNARDGSPWNNIQILNSCLNSSFYNQVINLRRNATWNRESLGVFKVEGYQVKQQGQGDSSSNDLSGATWATALVNAIRAGSAGSIGDLDAFEAGESRAIREGFLPIIASGDYSIFDIAAVINSSDLTRREKTGFMAAYRNFAGRAAALGSRVMRWNDGEDRNDQWWSAQAAEPNISDVNPYDVIDEFCRRIKGDVVVTAGISNDFSQEITVGAQGSPRSVNLANAMLKNESMLFWLAAAFEQDLLVSCSPEEGGSAEQCRAIADEAEALEDEYDGQGMSGVQLLPISDEVFEAIFTPDLEGFTGPPTPSSDILDCAAGDQDACERAGIGPEVAGAEVAASEEPSVLDRIQASSDINLLFLDNDFDHDRTSILGSTASQALSQIATSAQHRPARLSAGFADAMRRVLDDKFDTWWSSWTSSPNFDEFDEEHRGFYESTGNGLWADTESEKKEIYKNFLVGPMGSQNPRTPLGGVFELGPPRNAANYNAVALGQIMDLQGYSVQGSSSMGDYFYPVLKDWLFEKWGMQSAPEED